MSRTYKDKKWSLRYPENDYWFGTEKIPYQYEYKVYGTNETQIGTRYTYLDIPGAKKKKKRTIHGDWEWLKSTPSWWTRMTMTKPKRRGCRLWERQVLQQDIEEADCPDYGKKPYVYFY